MLRELNATELKMVSGGEDEVTTTGTIIRNAYATVEGLLMMGITDLDAALLGSSTRTICGPYNVASTDGGCGTGHSTYTPEDMPNAYDPETENAVPIPNAADENTVYPETQRTLPDGTIVTISGSPTPAP